MLAMWKFTWALFWVLPGTQAALFRKGIYAHNSAGPTPEPPTDVRQPSKCSCDFCTSEDRMEPTKVAKWKCSPSFELDPGQTCQDTESVIDGADQGITYTLFCLCHCQPLLEKADASCVPFEKAELEAAEKKDANCKDPKLPTQMEQDAYANAEEAAKAAKKAAAEMPEEATEEQKEYLEKINTAADEAEMRAGFAKTAAENAEMISKLHADHAD